MSSIFEQCYQVALTSGCQKMSFGCVITQRGAVVATGANRKLEPLRYMCEPTCSRFSLQSRTESMLGACAHAEEIAMHAAVGAGIPLNECDLYILGILPDGNVWVKNEVSHSCIRCSVQDVHGRH